MLLQMTSSTGLRAIYKDLANDHRQVMELLDLLREQRKLEDLLPLLEALRNLLIVHFGREQLPEGLYEALGSRAESGKDEMQALIKEHGTLLETLNELLDDARKATSGAEAEMISRLGRLVDEVHAHEHREHRFVVDVLGK